MDDNLELLHELLRGQARLEVGVEDVKSHIVRLDDRIRTVEQKAAVGGLLTGAVGALVIAVMGEWLKVKLTG